VQAASRSRRDGLLIALGIWPAGVLWSAAGMAGVGQIVAALPSAEVALRVICGSYLIWLGVRALRASAPGAGALSREPAARLLWRGFLTSLGNPKAMAYFPSIFAATDAFAMPWQWQVFAILLLPSIGFAWYATLVLLVSGALARAWLDRAAGVIGRVAGGIMILFGIKLLALR
jgi:threonine/homoserine/homoserine lactone efflux protein